MGVAVAAAASMAVPLAHAQASSLKGSSCAHPYKVYWLVPGHEINIRGANDGEVVGDTHFIKARAEYKSVEPATMYGFVASWKPRIGGLKVCRARVRFLHRTAFVSHQWHRGLITLKFNTEMTA